MTGIPESRPDRCPLMLRSSMHQGYPWGPMLTVVKYRCPAPCAGTGYSWGQLSVEVKRGPDGEVSCAESSAPDYFLGDHPRGEREVIRALEL